MKKIIIFSIFLIIIILGLDFFTKSGIYFILDSLFYPVYELQSFFSQSFYRHIKDILTMILGYKLYLKIYFLFVIITGTFLGYKIGNLVNKIIDNKDEKKLFLLQSLSISFILLNPFTYERFLTQTGIILAVFFIGLGLIYLLEYVIFFNKEKNIGKINKKFYISALFFGIAFNIMPHTAVFMIILIIITLLFFIKKFSLKKIFFGIFIFLVVNFNWLIGSLFLGINSTAKKIEAFNYLNIEAFKINNLDKLGTELTNFFLYGFWGEKSMHAFTPSTANIKWYIGGGVILFIIILGIYFSYKKNKKITLYLGTIGIVSYILSMGISGDIFSFVNNFLYNNIPYYIGMREPQKLTGLLMIVYSIFFIFGAYFILEKLKKITFLKYLDKRIFNTYSYIFVIFLLIIAWSPNVLFAFRGQLKISDYPKEIFTAREFLLKNNNDKQNLILPWHSYMSCTWTNYKVISFPVGKILEPIKTITADNIEIGEVYSNSKNKRSKQIEKILKNKKLYLLKELKIKNILFFKTCADYKNYKYLENNKYLENIFEKDNLIIYKIK